MLRKLLAAAAVLMATATAPALASAGQPTVRVCTGKTDGNYHFAGIQFAQQARGVLNVVLVPTEGSLDNLAKLDKGECDTAIVQSDAYTVYAKQNPQSALTIERGRALYQEYLHLICNTNAGISKITQLTNRHTVLVGPNGGGSAVTWASFVLADKKRYERIPTRPVGGVRALNMVQEGSDASCMLFVAGLRAPSLMEANAVAATSNGRLALIAADDSDMPSVKDPRGRSMYTKVTIPGGTYKNLQSGFFSSSVDTIAVEALIVANTSFVEQNEGAYNALLRAVNNSIPAINNRLTGAR